jgi:tetratricopeptide (TPR) repeat protein
MKCLAAALDLRRLLLPFAIGLLLVCVRAQMLGSQSQAAQPELLKLHYEAAEGYERVGDQQRATEEYQAFLAEALHRIANGEALAGEFETAVAMFDEASGYAPQDQSLRLDYARVCLDAEKLAQAKSLAEEAVRADPKDPQTRFLLGRVLFHLEDYSAAKVQLEAAVAANPDFKTGYLLGRTYLVLHDEPHARMLFDEMVAGLGDTALIHIYFGRAYSLMDYPDQAVEEFKKAIAKDSRAVDAHYYLALHYLRHDESMGYAKAIPEFQAELRVNPNDVRSHYMLGYIALKQSRFAEAEAELSEAAALQPSDLNTLVNLAEAYTGENRLSDAEVTLRKALLVAGNDPQLKKQSGRAHYLLGRLLMKTGREEDARKELALAAHQEDTRGMSSGPAAEARAISSSSLTQQEARDRSETLTGSTAELRRVEDFKRELSPLVGKAYNDLGVFAAGKKDYSAALRSFEKASTWNPGLEGLDRNLGMAAYYAREFDKAGPPLRRYLDSHPEDKAARAALEEALKKGPGGS